jgi:hypothetical protein
MAGIIPRLNEQVGAQVSNPVPVHNPQAASIASEAQAGAAANFTKAVAQVGEHFQRQQDMEDRIQSEVYSNRVKDGYMLAKDKAQRESAQDGSDFLDKFDKNVAEMEPDIYNGIEKYPGAKNGVQKYAQMAYNSVKTSIVIDSAKMKEADNYNQMEGLADKSADRVRGNPKPEMVEAELKSYGNMLDDLVVKGTMTPKNRIKIMDAYKSKIAGQYIEGLSQTSQYNSALKTLQANQENPDLFTNIEPAKARELGFIDSTKQKEMEASGQTYNVPVLTKAGKNQLAPALTEVMNGMDAKTKGNLIDSLRGKALAEGALKLSDLHASVSGFEQVAMAGGQYSDEDVGKIKAQINTNPYLDAQARVRLNDKINTADAVNKQVQLLANTPREKWGQVIGDFDKKVQVSQDHAAGFDDKMGGAHNDFAVQANRMEAKQKLEKYAANIQKMQNEHPAEFVMQTDKSVATLFQAAQSGQPGDIQRYAQASLAKQDFLGIEPDNQKVLPNAASTADTLKNQPSGTDAAKFIDNLQGQWGPYFPRVMAELSAQDKSLKKYVTTTYASPVVRQQLTDAIRNEPAINKAFLATPGAPDLHSAIRQAATSQLEIVQRSLLNGANSVQRQEIVNSMREAIELQARREVIKPGADVTKVVQEAYQNTIESQFQFESGGQSNALVPKNIGGMNIEPGIVSAFLRAHSTPEGVAELNPRVPKSYSTPDSYHQAIQREGRWLTNDQFDGVQLKLRNPETGNFMPVLDKLGKPIEVKYKDINLNPTNSTKQQSSFLGRMFSNVKQGANWVNQNVEYNPPFN